MTQKTLEQVVRRIIGDFVKTADALGETPLMIAALTTPYDATHVEFIISCLFRYSVRYQLLFGGREEVAAYWRNHYTNAVVMLREGFDNPNK